MKKSFIFSLGALSIIMLVLFAGCKDKKQPQSLFGDLDKPVWIAPDGNNMTSSMTALVKVNLLAQNPDLAADFVLDGNDLLGAFAGEQCIGIAPLEDGFFFVYINEPETEDSSVTLRYYSAHYKNIFEAKNAFPYRNDDHLGTVAEPFVPAFVLE